MAAIDTFDWMIKESFPEAAGEFLEQIKKMRNELQGMRNEDQRYRYIEESREYLKKVAARLPSK